MWYQEAHWIRMPTRQRHLSLLQTKRPYRISLSLQETRQTKTTQCHLLKTTEEALSETSESDNISTANSSRCLHS